MWQHRKHILIIDDDERICALLLRYLQQNGYYVSTAADTAIAEHVLQSFLFDVIILDVMMPKENGIDWAHRLRASEQLYRSIPILMLTAMAGVDNRISGLESGVDDYLVKPFEPKELVLRLRAIMRRSEAQRQAETEVVHFGRFTFHVNAGALSYAGRRVALSASERVLLSQLARYHDRVLSRRTLYQALDMKGNERVIDTQIKRLRELLTTVSGGESLPLETRRGQGYVLRCQGLRDND